MGVVSCVFLDLIVVRSFLVPRSLAFSIALLTYIVFSWTLLTTFDGLIFIFLLLLMATMNSYVLAYSSSGLDISMKRIIVLIQSSIVSISALMPNFEKAWMIGNMLAISFPYIYASILKSFVQRSIAPSLVIQDQLSLPKFLPKALLVWAVLIFTAFKSSHHLMQGEVFLLRSLGYSLSFSLILFPLLLEYLSPRLFNTSAMLIQVLICSVFLISYCLVGVNFTSDPSFLFVAFVFNLFYPMSLRFCVSKPKF